MGGPIARRAAKGLLRPIVVVFVAAVQLCGRASSIISSEESDGGLLESPQTTACPHADRIRRLSPDANRAIGKDTASSFLQRAIFSPPLREEWSLPTSFVTRSSFCVNIPPEIVDFAAGIIYVGRTLVRRIWRTKVRPTLRSVTLPWQSWRSRPVARRPCGVYPTGMFDDFADAYEAMIDWPKRLAHEEPFYRRLFDRLEAGACSTWPAARGSTRRCSTRGDCGSRGPTSARR